MNLRHLGFALCLAALLGAGLARATEPLDDNVVVNSFFDAGVTSWSIDPPQGPIQPYNHVSLAFDATRDVDTALDSGSLQVASQAQDANTLFGAAIQCVPVDDTRSYLFSGGILIPPGTPLSLSFTARLEVRFFALAGCSSALSSWIGIGSQSSTISVPDQWYEKASGWLLPPNGARSASVRAEIETLSGSQYGQTAVANFDSITFVPEPDLVLAQLAALCGVALVRRRG